MAEFNSPFSPFGATKPEEELLYPEQGMQFGGTGGSLFGAQPTDGGIDPTALAGLGLGGGFVAAGTGGQAATSQVLSPMAQKIAAQDAARLAAQNRPLLIGQPTTTQGVLVPETRLVQQTQLANPKQLPAVLATGGAPAPTGQIVPSGGSEKPPIRMAEKVDQPRLTGTVADRKPSLLKNVVSDLSKGFIFGAATTPNTMGDATISGAYNRLMEAGDVERAEALGYTDPLTEIFNAAYQEMLARKNVPPMSRLSDEPLTFTAPTGPSSTATQSAQLAATLPDDSGLMGAPGIQGTGIPTTTLDIDGGSATVPQALADQTFRGIGAAPMGVEETRARLGGLTLNEYLNAPSGTEGVSGLRTDPQGRMVPSGFETRADAYGDYERESAAREGRLAARMQQPGETITERDTRNAAARTQSSQNVPTDVREAMLTPEGRRTAKQINRLARWSGSTQGQEMGGVAGLEQSLQPVDAQQQQYDAMRLYKLGLEIDKMQQEKPSEYQEAAAGVDEAIAAGSIKPEDRNKFILRDLGWQAKEGEDSSDLMSIIYGDSSKSGGEPVLVKTQEEYENLAKGTRYTDEDGNIATKK